MIEEKTTRREFLRNVSGSAVALGMLPLIEPIYASTPTPIGTGYIYDDRMLNHIIEPGHVECPERLIKIQEKMAAAGLDQEVMNLPVFDDPLPWIRKIHTNSHILSVQQIPNTCVATEVAAAGALAGAKAVCEGTVKNAFCAIRPCGHHAHNTGQDEGFCYYNNVAIATKYVQEVFNIEKVLIIDWDYHHGNATQDTFYQDGTVLFCSTHDRYGYPQTGNPSLTGEGDGAGLNINIHLPPDSDEDDVKREWDDRLLPKVESFKPDFVFISAGFDSRVDDIKGNLAITDTGFAELTKIALEIAKTYSNDRLCSLLEGGYYIDGTATATVSHVTALLEGSTGIYHKEKNNLQTRAFVKNGILFLPFNKNRVAGIAIKNTAGTTVKTLASPSIDNGKIYLNKAGLAAGQYFAVIKVLGQREQAVQFLLTR